jgi:urease accessory protein
VTLLVRELVGDAHEPHFAGRRRDPLAVSSEDARRRRLRGDTAEGTDVALDLPRGTFIRHDAVLHDDGERIIVAERSPEPALVVRLDAALPAETLVEQAALVAHWAGNQHLLVEPAGHELRIRIATTPELMLAAARDLDLPGAEWLVADVPFARDHAPTSTGHSHG